MKRAILFAFLVLAGCGSGAGTPGAEVPAATSAPSIPATPPNAVASVTVNADFRQGDPSGEYLVDVTFRTAAGAEYNVEYCDTPIKVGDLVTLQEYGVGTTLIFVGDVMVGNIIDWPATEAEIDRIAKGGESS